MPYSDLNISRQDIDGVAGATLGQVPHSGTAIGLSENDGEILQNAKREMKLDLQEDMSDLLNDEGYDTITDVLDGLYDADTASSGDNMLKLILVYKFLELFFKDDSVNVDDGRAMLSEDYGNKYFHYLRRTEAYLRGMLPERKLPRTYRMVHGYG